MNKYLRLPMSLFHEQSERQVSERRYRAPTMTQTAQRAIDSLLNILPVPVIVCYPFSRQLPYHHPLSIYTLPTERTKSHYQKSHSQNWKCPFHPHSHLSTPSILYPPTPTQSSPSTAVAATVPNLLKNFSKDKPQPERLSSNASRAPNGSFPPLKSATQPSSKTRWTNGSTPTR